MYPCNIAKSRRGNRQQRNYIIVAFSSFLWKNPWNKALESFIMSSNKGGILEKKTYVRNTQNGMTVDSSYFDM